MTHELTLSPKTLLLHRGPLIITGTDTGVGKTIATAALATFLHHNDIEVEVIKVAQTGDDHDAAAIQNLSGVSASALAFYPDPLAPLSAARVSGLPTLDMEVVLGRVHSSSADIVLLEGAGGLLVQLGTDGWTIADLAGRLGCPAIVVARSGLGTLNHTALTLEALRNRQIPAGLIIGSYSEEPDLAEQQNLIDLPGPRLAVLPENLGSTGAEEFQRKVLGLDWGYRQSGNQSGKDPLK